MTRIERLKAATLARVSDFYLDRARLVTESYRATEGEPIIIRRAKAMAHFVENAPLAIYDDELLVGDRSWVQPYDCNFPEQRPKGRPENPDPAVAAELAAIWSYWLDDRVPAPTCTSVKGHCVPGFHKLMDLGFSGIAEQACKALQVLSPDQPRYEERRDFLEAAVLLAEACAQLGGRFARLARELAEMEQGARRQELLDIAETCSRVPAAPPLTFREAVQTLWFGELLVEIEDSPNAQSPGRADQLLWPFYQNDLESGRLTRDEAKELIACLWLKLWAPYDVHDTVIGGLTPDGKDATNDLSHLILEVQREVGLRRQLSLRYHRGMTDEFLSKVCDSLRDGLGVPQFFNDDVLVPALESSWLPIEAARSYSIIGCIEMTVPGEGDPRAVAHYSNLPKCLEYVFTRGFCNACGQQMGLDTGDPNTIDSFNELFSRYRAQVVHELREPIACRAEVEAREARSYPMPMLSLFTDDCIGKGLDLTQGGARYNSTMFCAVGIPNVADSLAAVRKLVFEEGRITLPDLLAAVAANFEGYEEMQQMLCTQAPKYGNDDDYVDRIALDVATHYANELKKHTDARGGPFTSSFFSFVACVNMGKMVGATPDGRAAGAPLANSLCAPQGNMRRGPSAMLKSAAKVNHLQATGGTSMLLDLHPSAVQRTNGHDPLASLLRTYFDLGGSHIEVTLADERRLREAQLHPEKFQDLTVRVAGYSAVFVQLSRELQDHVIERMKGCEH